MVSFTSIITFVLVVAGITSAKSIRKTAAQPVVTYLGTQGPILSSGAWTSKGIVYTSGTVPTFNGSIITGGIEAQTVCIQALYAHLSIRLTSDRRKLSRTLEPFLKRLVRHGTML